MTGSPSSRRIAQLARALERRFGRPEPPKRLPPPLDVLIATILSQHTSDTNSRRAFQSLRRRFPRWNLVAETPVQRLAAAIRSGGLADQKARRIRAIVRGLNGGTLRFLTRMSDEMAMDRLCSLDGVGPKTAACVLLFSLGRNILPVDVHVHRVLTRIGIVPGSTSPDETFRRLARRIPQGMAYPLHMNLIRLGRTVCRPSRPACDRCPLEGLCASRRTHDGMTGSPEPARSLTR